MSPDFGIRLLKRDHTMIIEVEGEIDLVSAPLLADKLAEAAAADADRVVVDVDRVKFMDANGLHVLLDGVILDGDSERFALTRGSSQVRRLFELSGTLDRLPFTDARGA